MALESGNNFYNAVRGVMGLFSSVNKAKRSDEEDTESTLLPEFESTMSDEDIRELTMQWEDEYNAYAKDIKQQQKDNKNYWIGKQFNDLQIAGNKRPLVDNLMFEAIETFLPIATRSNPQAMVFGDGSEEGEKLARTVTKALEYQANRQQFRMKLKSVTRNWTLFLIGALKMNWNSVENDMDSEVIISSRLILDKNASIGVDGRYDGEFLGLKKKATASRLINMFPKKKEYIQSQVDKQTGTKLNYREWWTRTDVFFMLNDQVLGKYKNPHWNYDNPETGEEGKNHFAQPEYPFMMLSIFNLGMRPHDETSLVTQNIPLQDLINKRYQQIEANVDSQNNGIVLSGKYFTKEQAAEAATQLAKGNPLWVPEGDIRASYARDQAPALSPNVFEQLEDARNELRNIFGTSGSTPEAMESQKTARGKILINQLDASRIGGGITEYLEQFSSYFYNWCIQMMYVYYTEAHAFSIVGSKAQELMSIKNTDFTMKLTVMVKDGSLIPKDPLTKRNEAIDLWNAQAIDPISLYSALDYPNPYESAKELLMWKLIEAGKVPPQMLFPDFETPPVNLNPADVTSPAVNGQEDNMNIQEGQVINNNPDNITSKELMSSVKI